MGGLSKATFRRTGQVLKYLARYTHRVAISSSRILSIEDGKVTFLWKDYADGNQTKVMTLAATESIRRFLLHILAARFVRIRQYGFLANRARKEKLALCRTLLSVPPPASAVEPRNDKPAEKPKQKRGPVCATGHMILIQVFRAERLDSS
jgi:hypothetical protein